MVAIAVFLFPSGRAYRDLDGGRATGDDRPRTRPGVKRSGRRPTTAFLFRDAKPQAAEKSWRRALREDE
ncbi:hypothetical protein [Neorhizobium sp. DAR64861/K0K2]|uniref:hypothetical protein n=1 Tax=unclassified Neorhizobium TaxID=2629175 RepID=UPI003D2AF214